MAVKNYLTAGVDSQEGEVNKALMMEIMKVKVIQTNQCGILEIKRDWDWQNLP